MIWLALSAPLASASQSLHPPPTKEPRGIFSYEDYPAGALARGEEGVVIARLVADLAGKVETCTVIYSSHSKELDDATCKILLRRATFKPATNDDDRPIYSVVITPPITWSIGGPSAYEVHLNPDVELRLNQAPSEVSLPLDVSIDYVVTARGEITSCEAEPTTPPVLAKLACAPASVPSTQILHNSAGIAVDALYSAIVRFTLDKR